MYDFDTIKEFAARRGLILERIETKQIDGVLYRYELDNLKGMTGLYTTLTEIFNDIESF